MGDARDGAPPRVLVIEDDRSLTRVLRLSLGMMGYEAMAVASGGDALRLLEGGQADAVILDLGLPDGLGGAVLEWLRSREKERVNAPVWVVISARDREEVLRCYSLPESSFVPKPFDPWALVRLVEQKLSVRG